MSKDRWYQRIPDYWPIIAALAALIMGGVRAEAQIGSDSKRIDKLEADEPHIADRLDHIEQREARIEQRGDDMADSLKRIETKVDRIPR